MATSENTVLVSFNVLLRSKQIVPWTILPVDRTMTVAELCKSIFVSDFTDIKEVEENNNPFVNFDLKYEVSVGKPKSTDMDSVFPSVKVSEIVELFGRYFQIGIHEKNLEVSTLEETMNKKKSAFAVPSKHLCCLFAKIVELNWLALCF